MPWASAERGPGTLGLGGQAAMAPWGAQPAVARQGEWSGPSLEGSWDSPADRAEWGAGMWNTEMGDKGPCDLEGGSAGEVGHLMPKHCTCAMGLFWEVARQREPAGRL